MNLGDELKKTRDLFEILPEKITLEEGRFEVEKEKGSSSDWEKLPREKLEGWPHNPGSYELRDPSCPVAFVCPSQSQELQNKAINWGAAISGPCVTPDRGVEIMIANIVGNPNIRYLVLGGKDSGHLSGDVIYSLWRWGIDKKTRRVKRTNCPTNPYLRNLPLEVIERFRKQVTVLNLLKVENEEILHLAIRACLQEPEHPLLWRDKKLDLELLLFDRGSEGLEPINYDLSLKVEKGTFFEGVSRVGASIHSPNTAEAWPLLKSHILNRGEMGINESTRRVKDVVGTQVVIHRPGSDLVPEDWKPHGWIEEKKEAEDWLEKYATWVYLYPFSDVKKDEKQGIVPYIPDKMDYSYGTRLTAWGVEEAKEEEKERVRNLVKKEHEKFIDKPPSFDDVLNFYKKLEAVQKESVNSLWSLAQAVKICVENEITSAYRNYVVLQHPRLDLKPDLRLAHNPCFCLYEVYPRKIKGKWQLDAGMFLRANDFVAFPANAGGGIRLQSFLSWFAGINPGVYLHHTGCAHIQDYLL